MLLCTRPQVLWTMKAFIKTTDGGFICKYADTSHHASFLSAHHLESVGVEDMSEG